MRQLLTFIILSVCSFTIAQNGYDWGENKPEATNKWFYVDQHVKAGDFETSKPRIYWLLNNAPNLKVDLYIQAAKVYEKVEEKEKNAAKKVVLQDSILWIYDERIRRFGDEANVLNRKGLIAYKFLAGRKEKTKEVFELYQKIHELNKTESYSTNILYYQLTAANALKKKLITENEFLDIYFLNSDYMDHHIEEAGSDQGKVNRYMKMQGQLDAILEKNIVLDCKKINDIFGSQMSDNVDNYELAKKIYRLMKKSECYTDELFYTTIHIINEHNPSATGFRSEGEMYVRRKDYSNAIVRFDEALALAKTDDLKSPIFMDLAKVHSILGKKSSARTYAYQAIEAGANKSEAYTLIGDLYLYSFEDCKSDNVLQTRAIYIAAYNMYKKAGNTSKMNEAKKNFPSGEDIFNLNKEVGDTISTGCWINENVVLQKR